LNPDPNLKHYFNLYLVAYFFSCDPIKKFVSIFFHDFWSTCLWRVLKTVEDGPVVPDSFRGQLADVLHHGKVLLAGRALRYQIPLQVGGLRVLAAYAGGQAENRNKAEEETTSELTAHFWRSK
jgi:hypothetical protein